MRAVLVVKIALASAGAVPTGAKVLSEVTQLTMAPCQVWIAQHSTELVDFEAGLLLVGLHALAAQDLRSCL